ncbi:hypothetical protein [Gordonia sp. (in: high G+C Gram-positive bacteria)]|uniref:hypothetical protein n=1 Tax=Gordonia sp. (in: high G+C Gram-positive bacteria) TaxID=84139 RepID=UPI00263909EE|nr:hypothetical protein [Gordonia sp. (in: high G+C Gram-positive bacteria)]
MTYHPWRDARARTHVDIAFVDHLPAGVRGRVRGDRIEIDATALQAERRCALAHELVHHERGVVPAEPVLAAREESIVEQTAARRLVSLDRLIDVLAWTRHASEAADELWIDLPMLGALIASLTDAERRLIEEALADRWAA